MGPGAQIAGSFPCAMRSLCVILSVILVRDLEYEYGPRQTWYA
jgi:hypothetical protein